jgi:hypothetical protein
MGEGTGGIMLGQQAFGKHPDHSDGWRYFSFWKPEPIPTAEKTIQTVTLRPLGDLPEVAERMLDLPCMQEISGGALKPWGAEHEAGSLLLHWARAEGATLQLEEEAWPPLPGKILSIGGATRGSPSLLYNLYVQLFEQLGVTLLDEKHGRFLTPRDFRRQMAS